MRIAGFLAALCCTAVLFAACEKDEQNNDLNSSNDEETGWIDGHQWVDLGLPSGTKWATCNVGADKETDSGDYFAWAETTTKDSYDVDNYKYSVHSGDGLGKLTKYCNDQKWGYNGFTDNLRTLESSDDAATANWGNNWRTPSPEEWEELFEHCLDVHWYNNYYYYGYLVTGKNYRHIFLPHAGFRSGTTLREEHSFYWSNRLSDSPSDIPFAVPILLIEFRDFESKRALTWRIDGATVRAVVNE